MKRLKSQIDTSEERVTCGVCGSEEVQFDDWIGINICLHCGAHETRGGWQKRPDNTHK
jgi:hypothetical protein